MKKKVFVVMYCDYGETVDGKPRLLGIFTTREKAVVSIKDDMDTYIKELDKNSKPIINKNKFSVSADDHRTGCEWAVEEYDLELS